MVITVVSALLYLVDTADQNVAVVDSKQALGVIVIWETENGVNKRASGPDCDCVMG